MTPLTDLDPGALAEAYDGRAMLAASFCQDKQALGLVTRRQRRWEAQQRVLLWARLAHHLLLWGNQWRSRVPATRRRLQGYGFVRLLRDVWAVPGVIRWRRGGMVSVRCNPLHPLATPLQESFSALFRGRVRVGYLRSKLAAAALASGHRHGAPETPARLYRNPLESYETLEDRQGWRARWPGWARSRCRGHARGHTTAR